MSEPFYRAQPSVVGWLLVGQALNGYFKVASRILAPHDVSPQQALALGIISQHGDPKVPMTPGHLARHLGQETQSITGLIDRLESRGWIARQRTLADRRKVVLELTDEGRRLLRVFMPAMRRACDEAFTGIAPDELDQFIGLLRRTNDGIRERLGREVEETAPAGQC
jgi:DNA-binding MarR family transcriptional regulator